MGQPLSASTTLSLHLYGDMYTATSATATDSTFVTYDDVLVSSSTRGTILTEDFESGISAWGSCSGNLALAAPGTAPDQWKRDVIYLGGEAIAEVDAAGVRELHNDHLGSPRVITAGSTGMAVPLGAVEGRQVFGPYGEAMPNFTSGYAPLTGYTGHLQQDPSGLTYMRGRFYSPAWHRFLNSDQGVDPSTFNQMAYVGGSPFQRIDPFGLKASVNCEGGALVYRYTDDKTGETTAVIIGFCGDGGYQLNSYAGDYGFSSGENGSYVVNTATVSVLTSNGTFYPGFESFMPVNYGTQPQQPIFEPFTFSPDRVTWGDNSIEVGGHGLYGKASLSKRSASNIGTALGTAGLGITVAGFITGAPNPLAPIGMGLTGVGLVLKAAIDNGNGGVNIWIIPGTFPYLPGWTWAR